MRACFFVLFVFQQNIEGGGGHYQLPESPIVRSPAHHTCRAPATAALRANLSPSTVILTLRTFPPRRYIDSFFRKLGCRNFSEQANIPCLPSPRPPKKEPPEYNFLKTALFQLLIRKKGFWVKRKKNLETEKRDLLSAEKIF